jgi:hypothetical protein
MYDNRYSENMQLLLMYVFVGYKTTWLSCEISFSFRYVGPLSSRHGASSDYECRWSPGMERSCEYIEQAVADSRQGGVPPTWELAEA